MKNQQLLHADRMHAENQRKAQLLKKLFNIQVHVQQHQNHQQHPIQAAILNAKKKVFIRIHAIVKNTFGV